MITAANASELAAKSHEARRLAKLMLENGDVPKPLLPDEKHQKLTLSRVRAQLERCFQMMAKEEDPGKMDRLASAIARLNELDRQLTNRSMPPTLKANAPARRQKSAQPGADPEFVG